MNIAHEDPQDSAQPRMLPEGYTVSDDELRQMQAQHREREKGVPAPDLGSRSPVFIILLGGGLVLSAIATLLGAGGLILAFVYIATSSGRSYEETAILVLSGLGLVLLVPGIVGLRACIRRIKVVWRRRA